MLSSIGVPSSQRSKVFTKSGGQTTPPLAKPSLPKGRASHEDDKKAKLLRERSTAQKRRQCKREELQKLSACVHDLEGRLAKLRARVEGLTDAEQRQVAALQAQAGAPPLGCRLCSILDRPEEFASIERLVHHFRVYHTGDLRQRGDDVELQSFATEIPTEDSPDMSDNEDGSNDSDDDTLEEHGKSSSVDSLLDMKRKLRLKRNAASARKSRKRKRVQLERWRMTLPTLRFQVSTLEGALESFRGVRFVNEPDAEPDVISAAFALIGCSLAARMSMN